MARGWGALWPFRLRARHGNADAPEEAGDMESVTSAPAPQQRRRSSDELEQKRAANGTRMVLLTRLGIMALFSVAVASVAFPSWAYSDHVARQTLERVTANEHGRMLEFGSSILEHFASDASGTTDEIANAIRLIPGQITGDGFTQFERLRQMCPILLTILVSGGATMTRFVTPEGLMVGYRYLSPGSEEVLYLFANKTSLPPDVSGRSDMVWYEQNVDPKTGLTTSEARVTPAVDYRASEPYRKATETDGADWGLVWGWNGTLLFMTAQPVRDPSNGMMLGVALGAFDAVELSTHFDEIRPEQGLLYAVQLEGDEGELISTSDFALLGNDTHILGTGKLDAAAASYPVMRDSARFLLAHSGGKGWSRVGDVRYTQAAVAGSHYYLSTKNLVVQGSPMIIVLAVPRSTVWYQISRQTKAQFIAISLLNVAIMAGGCLLTMLLTGRVSREMLLRAELIRHLDAKRKAEQASDYKSQFLAAMSHDVRTPLCCIIGLLEVLLCDGRLSGDQRGSLKQVRHCALQLLDLLKAILDLSKVESGKLTLEPAPFDLGVELEALADMFAVQSAKKGVALVLDLDDRLPRKLVGDCTRVRQILANLIGNACKFTDSGNVIIRAWPVDSPASLTVNEDGLARGFFQRLKRFRKRVYRQGSTLESARSGGSAVSGHSGFFPAERTSSRSDESPTGSSGRREGSFTRAAKRGWFGAGVKLGFRSGIEIERPVKLTVMFEIEDTGIGIPPHLRPTVLGSFIQGSRASGGYGLGLAMVRTLVNSMGGTIRIVDKPGPGTLFRFDLVLEHSPETSDSPIDPFETPRHSLDLGQARRPFVRALSRLQEGAADATARAGAVTAVRRPPQLMENDGPLPSGLDGSAVLLLKGDAVGREAAAGWMARRGLRVYQAAEWAEVKDTLKRLMQEERPVDLSRLPGGMIEPGVQTKECDRSRDAPISAVGLQNRHVEVKVENEITDQGDARECSPGQLLLILDTSVIPGAPEPGAVRTAFRSLMDDLNLTAPDAPRVSVAWLVSVALPGAAREQLRASGCHLIASEVLHPTRLLSLLTAMVISADPTVTESILLGFGHVSDRSGSPEDVPQNCAPAGGIPRPAGHHRGSVDMQHEAMIEAGIEFTLGRGAVDDRGADTAAARAAAHSFPDAPDVSRSLRASRMDSGGGVPVARPAGQPGESPESKARGGANLPRKEAKHFGTGTGLSAVEETAEPETGTPTGRKSGSKGPLAGRHILLVEDTVLLRKLATTILTKVGATVYPVENGRQAVEAVQYAMKRRVESPSNTPPPLKGSLEAAVEQHGGFDLVLMDCQMPVLDGYGATREVRELEKVAAEGGENFHLPIVALTAHARATDKEKCLSVGMDDYLTKPINVKRLVSTVNEVILKVEASASSSN